MHDTLWASFAHSFEIHFDRIAVETADESLTYSELGSWSAAVAEQLHDLGVAVGDPVAIYLRNRVEFLVVDLAIARLGAVKVPINYMLPASTVSYILRAAGVRAVVFGHDLPLPDAGLDDVLPVIRVRVGATTPPGEGSRDLVGQGARGKPRHVAVTGDDPAAIYFTGGTTGRPKGVRHTQHSTVALHRAQMLEAEITDSDRLLLMTPLAHAAGLFAQTALIRGATIILTDGFDADETVASLASGAVTWTFLVPTMIYRILDRLIDSGLRAEGLRTVVYGAAPISPARLEQALEVFGPVFVQLYGQTECPNWGTRLTRADHDTKRPELLTSCGRASILAEAKVVDADGNEVDRGVVGEICLRSDYTLQEYLNDPDATAAKFLGDWIRTGDIGTMDEAGYVYLKDRKNDMIITGGMNVYGREVEDVLSAHPGVAAVAVIGIPHDDWGEAVHACVVPSGAHLDPQQLLAWAKPKLAAYAVPKSVSLLEVLPETPFGKVDKKALRRPYWVGLARDIG
jgi:fatty-acyl-CoA synthase